MHERQPDRAILVGRFQPIHNGHIQAIKQILSETMELVVVVGSAQLSHTLENPLTAGERVYMLHEAISSEGLDLSRTFIITIPDIQFNSVWPAHVRSYAPPFDVVYTSNPLVTTLFEEVGVKVRHPTMYDREECSGTNIRRLMLAGDSRWTKLVPASVAAVLEELQVTQRLRSISKSYEHSNFQPRN